MPQAVRSRLPNKCIDIRSRSAYFPLNLFAPFRCRGGPLKIHQAIALGSNSLTKNLRSFRSVLQPFLSLRNCVFAKFLFLKCFAEQRVSSLQNLRTRFLSELL